MGCGAAGDPIAEPLPTILPPTQYRMKLLHGFDDPTAYQGAYVSIGNFDGVHRGHRTMIARLVELARRDGVPAVVLTFSPHPIEILRPNSAPPPLTTLERKAELLGECGVDCVIVYPTDLDLLRLTPAEFFQSIMLTKLQARGMVEGENFFYGHSREGNVNTLKEACEAAGLTLEIITPVQFGTRVVSSSVIRKLIAEGNVAEASELLGWTYRLRGTVTHGAARGRTIGFPTANLIDVVTEFPKDGVYAGQALWQDRRIPAAINIGGNPTFAEDQRKFEVHLLDFQGDLYGQELEVEFLARLRNTQPFGSVDQLIAQLNIDVQQVRNLTAAP